MKPAPVMVDVRLVDAPHGRSAIRDTLIGSPNVAVFESLSDVASNSRYCIYAICDDAAVVRCDGTESGRDPFEAVAAEFRAVRSGEIPKGLPFAGGWVGWFGYECGQFLEPIDRRHWGAAELPAAFLRRSDRAVIHDRLQDTWWLTACDLGGGSPAAKLDQMEEWLAGRLETGLTIATASVGELLADQSFEEYAARVEQALRYIRAGDIYQVNLAQRFTAAFHGNPAALYQKLCAANPAAYAAYLPCDVNAHGEVDSAVLSSSPELFLELRGDRVVTRPIKGTRPRVGDAVRDAASRLELELSEKEKAELVMIVDLERNDLGRVCRYGSVKVTCAAETEIHPTVFHRVATVEGQLRAGLDAIDLLKATFPCGSITGAPKVRAMQIIDELEPQPRGAYCGAIGYLGVDGAMVMNVAIRTMFVAGGRVHLYAGGGIVADSDPRAEYEETLAKAKGMRRALDASREEADRTAARYTTSADGTVT